MTNGLVITGGRELNTKRSISERGQKQEEDNGEDNEIIYKGYDISEMVKQTENNIELEDKET